MQALVAVWHDLSERSQGWILSGQMTLSEARYLTTHDRDAGPGLSDDQVESCMRRRHGKHHTQMRVRFPDIDFPLQTFDHLVVEVHEMPDRIREAFSEGNITLIQARYATMRGFRGIVLTQFLRINTYRKRGSCPDSSRTALDEARAKAREDAERNTLLDQLVAEGRLDIDMASAFRKFGTPIFGIHQYVRAGRV